MKSYPGVVPDDSQELLFRLTSIFRVAIVEAKSRSGLPSLNDFPRGACSDASLLLAKYLQVKGCGMSHYVLGKRRGQAHAWLQLQGYIIDITADQFDDQGAAVIVSRDSSWHDAFNGRIHNVADFCLYDRSTVVRLAGAYQAITAVLTGRRGPKSCASGPL